MSKLKLYIVLLPFFIHASYLGAQQYTKTVKGEENQEFVDESSKFGNGMAFNFIDENYQSISFKFVFDQDFVYDGTYQLLPLENNKTYKITSEFTEIINKNRANNKDIELELDDDLKVKVFSNKFISDSDFNELRNMFDLSKLTE